MALRCFRNPRTGRTLSSVNGASLSHMRYMSEHSSSAQKQAPYMSHRKYHNRRRIPIIGPYNEQCDTKIGIFRYWPGLTTYDPGQSKRCTPFLFKKSRTAHVTSCILVRLSSVSRLFFFPFVLYIAGIALLRRHCALAACQRADLHIYNYARKFKPYKPKRLPTKLPLGPEAFEGDETERVCVAQSSSGMHPDHKISR